MLAISRIECGWVARENIGCRVVFRRQVHCGLVLDMMLGEHIQCPEGSVGWCGVVNQPLHHGEVGRWVWRIDWGMCRGKQCGWEG